MAKSIRAMVAVVVIALAAVAAVPLETPEVSVLRAADEPVELLV